MAGNIYLQNAFVQVNTLRGYRYLDDAGKIMNLYDLDFPSKEVGTNALRMSRNDGPLREVVVDVSRIWLHFDRPGSLTQVVDLATRHVREISEIIAVTHSNRFGFRVSWLFPARTLETASRAVTQLGVPAAASEFATGPVLRASPEFRWRLGETDSWVTFRLAAGSRADDAPSEIPDHLVVVDADIYQESDKDGIPIASFHRFARSAEASAKAVLEKVRPALEAALK